MVFVELDRARLVLYRYSPRGLLDQRALELIARTLKKLFGSFIHIISIHIVSTCTYSIL